MSSPDDAGESDPPKAADSAPRCPVSHEQPSGTETPYVEYARMGTLLSLQHPRTDAPTEPSFIIMSQVKELMFKLLHTELTTACGYLRQDKLPEVLWTLRRALKVQQAMIASWDVFSSMSPIEFAQFRDELGSASGFQSFSYRRLEFLLGNKNPKMVEPHRNSPAYAAVRSQLELPSFYDEVLAFLSRRQLPIPESLLKRDWSVPYQPSAEVEAVWGSIYKDPARYNDLHLLGETMVDMAEQFARWRYVHLVIVERTLGGKPGTGGTQGVPWLSKISEHRFFPELWSVRTTL